MLFESFDFEVLSISEFKEDSVREEIITPILHKLGYKAYGAYKIMRSKALQHPYVLFGTKKQKINIFPDYMLYVKDKAVLVLDAKSPTENIHTGKNVEQAYSYAIHPDVRVKIYALCNGKELTIFHINQIKPVLSFRLEEIAKNWEEIVNVLAPYKIPLYEPLTYNIYPDYGVMLHKLGVKETITLHDYNVPISNIARINDKGLFTSNINRVEEGIEYAVSFDFGIKQLSQFLTLLKKKKAAKIHAYLTGQPYKVDIEPPCSIKHYTDLEC